MQNDKSIAVKKHIIIALILIMIAQIACMICFGTIKDSFNMDEINSYGLSNSYYKPFPEDVGRWLPGSYFNDYLEVNKNDAFKYDSVYYNLTNDVSAPLFYYILHTVCSFSQNTFTKWTGIGINIFFFIGIILILFLLSRKLLKNDYLSLVVCLLYGFSIAAICSVMFIRMYVMFTFWVIVTVYLFTKLQSSNSFREKNALYIILAGVGSFGILTHNYFLIFYFIISLIYFIYLLTKKHYKDLFKFSICTVTSVLLAVFAFREIINQIFFGYRGTEAFSNLFNISDLFNNFISYFNILNNMLFSGLLLFFIIAIVLLIVLNAVLFKKQIFKGSFTFTILIFAPAVLYFLAISKISWGSMDRYILPVLPIFALSFVVLIKYILDSLIKNRKISIILISLISIFIIVFGFSTQNINYLNTKYSNNFKIAKQYYNNNCLIITKSAWRMIESVQDVKNYNNIYTLVINENARMDVITPYDDLIRKSKGIVIYLDNEYLSSKENSVSSIWIEAIKNETHSRKVKKLFEATYLTAYYFSK